MEEKYGDIWNVLQILENDEKLLQGILKCEGIDECYEFMSKIKDGYTKQELESFFDEIKVLTKDVPYDKIVLSEDLDKISGGAKLNKINQKALSVALSALTLTSVLPMNSYHASSLPKAYQKHSKKETKLERIKQGAMYGVVGAAAFGAGLGAGLLILNHVLNQEPRPPQNVGLANLGATCFYNSLLQQLYSIKSFRKFVDDYNCGDLKFEKLNLAAITADNIVNYKMCAFKYLFEKMDNPEYAPISRDDMVKFVYITIQCRRVIENGVPRLITPGNNHIIPGDAGLIYPGGQQDTHECYANYLADVVDEYKRHFGIAPDADTNICSSSLTVNEDTTLEQMLRVGQKDAIKIDTLFSIMSSDSSQTFRFIDAFWNETREYRIQGGQPVDLEKYAYPKPLNDEEYNINFQGVSDDDLIGFCSDFRLLNQNDDNIILIFNSIKMLRRKMQDGTANDQDKYDFYVLCYFYNYMKYQVANGFVTNLRDRPYELLCKRGVLDYKGKVFAMLTYTVNNGNMNISKDYQELIPGDYKDQITAISRMSLSEVCNRINSSENFKDLRKKISMLEIKPIDGQFLVFTNRTSYVNGKKDKNKNLIDLGDGKLKNYYGKNYYLSGITIQLGGADGGHYYTFKRSSENGKWYEYNDSTVTETNWEHVKEMSESNCTMLTYTEEGESTYPTYTAPQAEQVPEEAQKKELPAVFRSQSFRQYVAPADLQQVHLDNVQVVTTYPRPVKNQYSGITDVSLLKKISANSRTAIIDASNTGGIGGGGVDGAIFAAMGGQKVSEQLAEIVKPNRVGDRIPEGQSIMHFSFKIWEDTYGGNPKLGVPFVIQAVAPNLSGRDMPDDVYFRYLYNAYYNAMNLGANKGVQTFVAPALGLGVFAGNRQGNEEFGKNCAKVFGAALRDVKAAYPTAGLRVIFTDHQDERSFACTKAFFAELKALGATDFE